MKCIYLFWMICLGPVYAISQKPLIDPSMYAEWEDIGKAALSSDGNYFLLERPKYNAWQVGAIDGTWKKEFKNCTKPIFSGDSRRLYIKTNTDSLMVLRLNKAGKADYLAQVSTFDLTDEIAGWEAWLTKGNDLQLENLATTYVRKFNKVEKFFFLPGGKSLALITRISDSSRQLQWVDLAGKAVPVGIFAQIGEMVFSSDGKQLAFWGSRGKDDIKAGTIFFYHKDEKEAIPWVNATSPGLGDSLSIVNNNFKFSNNNNKLFFRVKRVRAARNSKSVVRSDRVDIWDYRRDDFGNNEVVLPSEEVFDYCIAVKDKVPIRLTWDDERMETFGRVEKDRQDYVLVTAQKGNKLDIHWDSMARPSLYLVATSDGNRKLLLKNILSPSLFYYTLLSPENRFVVYFDAAKKNYYSYDIIEKRTVNLTEHIPFPLYDDEYDRAAPQQAFGFNVAAWLAQDKALFVYDRFDIWKIDPEGQKPPANITNGYGRKHGIVLRFTTGSEIPVIDQVGRLVLTAFDRTSRFNGFYACRLEQKTTQDPELLTMGPYIYHLPQLTLSSSAIFNFPPIKAKNADKYLVRRMSAVEAPNYFFTQDFKKYRPISDLQPQKKYNWLTAELVRWPRPDNKMGEGILYRPENFDSTRRYPVIFHMYERRSDRLYSFIKPRQGSLLSIPDYVSKGYLVFVPDISYKLGVPGQGVLDAVVSAARFLSQKNWVDSTRLGLQGHSWGGYEVNFLISRTGMFAAAVSAAGPSDFVSNFGQSESGSFLLELGQSRLGATPWQNAVAYIDNSPVFGIDRITTPLLITHNKKDKAVPYLQGVELFRSLRRLRKPVWLLQYDNSDHEVQGMDAEDFSRRMMQFFDHYLMRKPAPAWMTNNATLPLKGNFNSFSLDTTGSCRPGCSICREWNSK